MQDTPIAPFTLPVLKRSDVKCNEVQLFSVINFGTSTRNSIITGTTITEPTIVPTRNVSCLVPMSTTYIPRSTIITDGAYDFYTLFDITIDLINSSAYYNYIMYEAEVVPILVTSYGIDYNIVCTKLLVSKVGNTAEFEISYSSTEPDYDLCDTKLKIISTSLIYSMTNDSINKKFTYIFNPYTLLPVGNIDMEFTVYTNSGTAIATYSTAITFSKSLNDFMMSNVSIDSTSTIIYDIPVVEKTYYDSIVQKDFESSVLQNMMTVMDFKSYRMLTDFTNLKFTNTIGTMVNMQFNSTTKSDCIDIGNTTPPTNPSVDDRYIIGYTESGDWANKYGEIAQCIDSTGPVWYYFKSISDDIIYVTNKGKKYIYNGSKWILMEYQIPLVIDVEIFKESTYYGSDIQLSNLVKDTLLTEYSSRFGPNITLYKSEIISTIQAITGVSHCNLIKPESNIFFDYKLESLSEQELLEYSAEYIYFNESSISVKVYN